MDVRLLADIQKQTGLSRKALAEKLGITRQAVEFILLKGGDCRAETLMKIWKVARDDCKWSAKRFLERLEAEFADE